MDCWLGEGHKLDSLKPTLIMVLVVDLTQRLKEDAMCVGQIYMLNRMSWMEEEKWLI